MIAARFRSLKWAAFAMAAGLGCYMVTTYVSGERRTLEKVEKNILTAKLAVRGLETELGTRASMAQLERWNSDTLALRAPKPEQYLDGVAQLASLAGGARAAPVPIPAAVPAPAAPVAQVAYQPEAPARVAPPPAPPAPRTHAVEAPDQPMLRNATYVRPARDHAVEAPRKVALLASRDPLSSGTLAELGRIARTEQSRSDAGGQ